MIYLILSIIILGQTILFLLREKYLGKVKRKEEEIRNSMQREINSLRQRLPPVNTPVNGNGGAINPNRAQPPQSERVYTWTQYIPRDILIELRKLFNEQDIQLVSTGKVELRGDHIVPFRLVRINKDAEEHNVQEVARFGLKQLDGCCGVLVSTGAFVNYFDRKKGVGDLVHKIRLNIAEKKNFGMVICTDLLTNKAQQKILDKNGWIKVQEFRNPETGNQLGLHYILLNQPRQEVILPVESLEARNSEEEE